jgi:hypothetical protein
MEPIQAIGVGLGLAVLGAIYYVVLDHVLYLRRKRRTR